jgi:hypothetical protein
VTGAPSRTFDVAPTATFEIPLPFDPAELFGRTRAAVQVTVNGHRWRSTVTTVGGRPWLPFRRSHRAAAGVVDGQPFTVTVTLDDQERRVDAPADLCAALDAAGLRDRWCQLSFTRRREDVEAVEAAIKPETRARRIARAVAAVSA